MYTDFRHRLSELLERHALSAKEFDRQIGIASGSSSGWVTGRSEPTISYAYRIARRFGYRCEDLAADALPEATLKPEDVERAVLVKEVGETHFGATLRHLLAQRRQSGRAFARELGMPPSTVRCWIAESSEPRLWGASLAAKKLGVSLHDMVTGALLPKEVDQDAANDRGEDQGDEQPARGAA